MVPLTDHYRKFSGTCWITILLSGVALICISVTGCSKPRQQQPSSPFAPDKHYTIFSFENSKPPYDPYNYWGCRIVAENSTSRIFADRIADCGGNPDSAFPNMSDPIQIGKDITVFSDGYATSGFKVTKAQAK
jgi:hypothetical protein